MGYVLAWCIYWEGVDVSAEDVQFLAAWACLCLVMAIAYGPGAERDVEARIFGGRRRNRRSGFWRR